MKKGHALTFLSALGAFLLSSFKPSYVYFGMGLLFFLFLIIVIQKTTYLKEGRKQRQNKFLVFWILLLFSFLLMQQYSLAMGYLVFFPMFLALYVLGMRWFHIGFFFLCVVGHLAWKNPELLVLGTITGFCFLLFSWLVSHWEMAKIQALEKKVAIFERESRKYLQDLETDGIEQKRIHQAIDRIQDEKKQFQNITHLLFDLFVPNTVALYLYDSIEDVFILKSYHTQSDEFQAQKVLSNQGIFLLVQKQAKTMQIQKNAIRDVPYYAKMPNLTCVLMAPLVSNDQLYGVVVLDHIEDKTYSQYEKSIVERITTYIASIMQDSKTIAQFDHLKQEFESFYQASSALNRALKLSEVIETLLHMAKSIAKYDWGCVVLNQEVIAKNMIVLDSEKNSFGLVGKTFTQNYQKGLVSWVIDQMKPLLYNDFVTKYHVSHLFTQKIKTPNLHESVLILPLYVQDQKLGALVLMSENNYFFTRTVQNMLEVLSLQGSIAIKNAMTVSELEKLATTDGLTGLLNHRTFQMELQEELIRGQRYEQETSLVLIDLDFFKKVNDDYGHPAGDAILKNTAQFLLQAVRETDRVARYGGEEFALILPNTSAKQALQLANRMVKDIEKQEWSVNRIRIPVTFSIGIASAPLHATDKIVLIEHADQALYFAKENGRNQACVFDKRMQITQNQLIENIERKVVH